MAGVGEHIVRSKFLDLDSFAELEASLQCSRKFYIHLDDEAMAAAMKFGEVVFAAAGA